jgi:hypothetical protein
LEHHAAEMPFVAQRLYVLGEINRFPIENAGEMQRADPLAGLLLGVLPAQLFMGGVSIALFRTVLI